MKKIPKFKNEDEEREFWATHSPLDYFDFTKAKRVELLGLSRTSESSFSEWDNEEAEVYDNL